jgi:hypothetical protein
MEKPNIDTRAINMGVKWPEQTFESNAQYIPIAGLYTVNGEDEPALGQYTERAPESGQYILLSIEGAIRWSGEAPQEGTYVLGSKDGVIQWIETEDC